MVVSVGFRQHTDLCVAEAERLCCAEYLQHPSYSFHFPGPHTGTCSLSDTKRAKFYGDLGGFSHATLTNSSVANKLIEAVSPESSL